MQEENTEDPGHNKEQTGSEQERKGPISFGEDDDPTRIRVEKNPGELISGIWGFIRSILSLRSDTYNIPAVVDEIRSGVQFKGYNVWVLGCSIVVASVGLNMDSTAVIVGAMLISPLMGPIRGIGFGVGMNDFGMLVDSLKNFGITVGISVFVATVYFWITPIDGLTHELAGRTEPTFMDVMIAFFGGLAGVIAATRGKNDTVLPGVAIATALMPPLCTAGYALANAEWAFFLGAMYLFLLNSLMIGLSTIIFIRYLKFPKKEYVSPKIERKVQNYIIIFMIVTISPSIYLFYKMAKRSIFEGNAKAFVEEVVSVADQNMRVYPEYRFDFKESVITLGIENVYIDSSTIYAWNKQKKNYNLDYAELEILQGEDVDTKIDRALGQSERDNEYLRDELQIKRRELTEAKKELSELEDKLSKNRSEHSLEMDHIMKGFKEEYPELDEIAIDQILVMGKEDKIDTTYALELKFYPELEPVERDKMISRIKKRFLFEVESKTNIQADTIKIIER